MKKTTEYTKNPSMHYKRRKSGKKEGSDKIEFEKNKQAKSHNNS